MQFSGRICENQCEMNTSPLFPLLMTGDAPGKGLFQPVSLSESNWSWASQPSPPPQIRDGLVEHERKNEFVFVVLSP